MEPGDRIENYVLIEQIGQGGQAVVWSAEDERLQRMVAIKTIDLTAPVVGDGTQVTLTVDEQAERFRSEARTIAELEHPHILPIYSFGQQGDWLYIVMRYMPGGTLRKLIQKEPFSLPQLLKVAAPLADALDMAHQHRIVHRDIKSVNVLLDAHHRPYLADFGLSVTVGDAEVQSGSGTLAYMSPEQIRGEMVDHRSDIYAFGILLYEMLTGDVPRVGNQHWNLVQVMSRAELPAPSALPEAVMNVLRRATAYHPQDRHQTLTELIDDLRAAGEGEKAPAETLGSEAESTILLLPVSDPAAQASIEAGRLFEAALEKWADGAGRFRFYEEDFIYVDSFYRVGEELGLFLDESAKRLLLRGALEYGHNLVHWWEEVESVTDRRAVALQTLKSELPAARLRAMEHLVNIEDSRPPAIPARVAAVIRKEPEASVRLAGVELLEQRASPARGWRDTAYNETIDGTLAALAADPDPAVAAAAARACARLHSGLALRQLAGQALRGDRRAFQALVLARDVVSSFPLGIPFALRRRVFAALSFRQFFAPGLPGRFLGAAVGFGLGWAAIQFFQYGERELLFAQAVGNSIASGALYGFLAGLAVLFAAEPAGRLRAWNRAGRIALSLAAGGLFSALLFIILRLYYYFNPEPVDNLFWLLGPIIVFAAGFAVGSGLTRRAWLRALFGAAGVLAAVYGSWLAYESGQTYDPILFFNLNPDVNQPLILSLWLALTTGVLTFAPEWMQALRRLGKDRADHTGYRGFE